MRKKLALYVMLVVVMFFVSIPPVVYASELTPSAARWNLAKKVGLGGLGFIAGAAGHYQLGHRLALAYTGSESEWHSFNSFTYYDDNDNDRAIVAGGGFMEQIISSEIILGFDEIPKDNAFVLGYMAWNILNPIVYTIAREFHIGNYGDGYGDLEVLDRSGWKAEYVEVAICAYALSSAWRLYSNKDFPLFVKATREEIKIGLRWEVDWLK